MYRDQLMSSTKVVDNLNMDFNKDIKILGKHFGHEGFFIYK